MIKIPISLQSWNVTILHKLESKKKKSVSKISSIGDMSHWEEWLRTWRCMSPQCVSPTDNLNSYTFTSKMFRSLSGVLITSRVLIHFNNSLSGSRLKIHRCGSGSLHDFSCQWWLINSTSSRWVPYSSHSSTVRFTFYQGVWYCHTYFRWPCVSWWRKPWFRQHCVSYSKSTTKYNTNMNLKLGGESYITTHSLADHAAVFILDPRTRAFSRLITSPTLAVQ